MTTKELPESAKDAIIARAIEACKWVRWIDSNGARLAVRGLKDEIEKHTGQEIEELT